MPQKKSKPTNSGWAALLQEELQNTGTSFPEGAVTFRELREERKKAGLPHGKCATYEWIRVLVKNDRITVHEGYTRGQSGRMVRNTRYLLKS